VILPYKLALDLFDEFKGMMDHPAIDNFMHKAVCGRQNVSCAGCNSIADEVLIIVSQELDK